MIIPLTKSDETKIVNVLSSRLSKIADEAVIGEFGITGLKQNTLEVKMKRQEAVIEELLSIILDGGVIEKSTENLETSRAGTNNNINQTISSSSPPSSSSSPSSPVPKEFIVPEKKEGIEVSLDEILFLLRSQQQELQEIRDIKKNSRYHVLADTTFGDDDYEDQYSPFEVSSYFNGPQHHSPDDDGRGNYFRLLLFFISFFIF